MGVAGGPNIERDGLVFGYDTGYGVADNSTATRFYPGKSVDNEFYNSGTNGNILNHSSAYGGYGTVQTGVLDAFGTTQNAVYRKTGKIRFGPTNGADIGTLYYGNTYTFSIYLRHVSGQPEGTSMELDIVDKATSRSYTGTLGSNMTYDWKRFWVTATHDNNSNYRFIDVGTYQGTNVFEWCMPQIELGTVASPFTSTERSSTNSLLDLTKSTTIDVSNVSFDSDGLPTFDGTDDYMQLPTSLVSNLNPSELTVEAVVYHTSWGGASSSRPYIANWNSWDPTTPNQRGFILRTYTTSQYPSFWYCWGADYSSLTATTQMSLNQYYHVVGVFKKDNYAKIYVNGTEAGSTTTGTGNNLVYDDTTGTRIGYGTINTGRMVGNMPVIKLYNRALTAQEVQQNYKAYKNRFNL